MKTTTTAARLAIGLCGCTVGAYCALSAFRNGQTLAADIDGTLFGAAFAAVVIGSWFILPLSRHPLSRAGWLMCTAFVLANAIGFTAMHRTEKVGDKLNTIAAYDAALAGLEQATGRLVAMKGNRRWESTSGCTDATVEQSIVFCDQFSATQATAMKFQAVVSAGKPATSDAQADTIGWVIRADTATVGKALPIFMAVVLDIAATLFMYLALAGRAVGSNVERTATVAKPKAKPAKSKKPTTRKKTAKQVAKLKKIAAKPTLFKPPVRITGKGRMDKRFKRSRPANENVNA